MLARSLGQEDPLGRAWPPSPVFLPGESHRMRSLEDYSLKGPKVSDTTEQLIKHTHLGKALVEEH